MPFHNYEVYSVIAARVDTRQSMEEWTSKNTRSEKKLHVL